MNQKLKGPSLKEKYKNSPAYQYVDEMVLGPWTTYELIHDPIHLLFVLSRYKFVARIMNGKTNVLEVGCGDAFGTPIVAQFVKKLVALDIDSIIIASDKRRLGRISNITFETGDLRLFKPKGIFDGVFAVDVIEHIEKEYIHNFVRNITGVLKKNGLCVFGTPNVTSEKYASAQSREYHVNMFSHVTLGKLLERYFHNVFW